MIGRIKDVLFVSLVIFTLTGLSYFYIHHSDANTAWYARQYYPWQKMCILMLWMDKFLNSKKELVKFVSGGIASFYCVNCLWQIFEFENQVKANQIKVLHIIFAMHLLIIFEIIKVYLIFFKCKKSLTS